jgi:hypothetical protein
MHVLDDEEMDESPVPVDTPDAAPAYMPDPSIYTLRSQPPVTQAPIPLSTSESTYSAPTPPPPQTWMDTPYAPMIPPVMRDQPVTNVDPMIPPAAR